MIIIISQRCHMFSHHHTTTELFIVGLYWPKWSLSDFVYLYEYYEKI
jgi:hypothetical protein